MSSSDLDRPFLDELLEGDREFAEELFQTFFESANSCLEQAQAMLSSSDSENVFRPFHTLKGASASVGLTSVKELASELEKKARQNDLAFCSENLPALKTSVEEGRKLLDSYLSQLV